jgi:hypothetical protein
VGHDLRAGRQHYDTVHFALCFSDAWRQQQKLTDEDQQRSILIFVFNRSGIPFLLSFLAVDGEIT